MQGSNHLVTDATPSTRPAHRQARTLGSLLMAGAAASVLISAARAAEAPAPAANTEEVVVTATRRSEDVRKVPVSVAAYSQEQMDEQGVRQIDDLARLTPDLQFSHTAGVSGNNSTNIAIRGIASDVGAPTTAIYIDDTPVQMRNIGYWNATAFPQVFDLQRVEVLRGPQGTLFGAGAEGGAVRFITPEPSLDKYDGYFRSELSGTVDGDLSYEGGAAVGGPIIKDKVGFRISAWGRRDGGYVDRVSPDTGATVESNSNWQSSNAIRSALTVAPTDALKMTASLFYQKVHNADSDTYWSSLSNPYAGSYRRASRQAQPTDDKFYLPALKMSYDWDKVSLISDTSYFYRRNGASLDYTNYFAAIFNGDPSLYQAGDQPSRALVTTFQHGVTHETRLQSTDKDSWLDWTTGLYYSRFSQNNQNLTTDGQAAYTSVYGNAYSFTQLTKSTDEQLAGYANIDAHVTDKLKLTAGIRVSQVKFDFAQSSSYDGVSSGPGGGSQKETPITPKFGVSYQVDPDNFLYLNAAKGFRPGGANETVDPTLCKSDLKVLGLSGSPSSYNSDSLWSYELGSKNTVLGGMVFLDSSLYLVKWNKIQQAVNLPSCGFSFVDNLGSATSIGGDVSATIKLGGGWRTGLSAGYNNTTYDKTIYEGDNAILVKRGDAVRGTPFSGSVWAQYDFSLLDDMDAFYRFDYTVHSSTPNVDPAVFTYDPSLPGIAANDFLSMRFGVLFNGWEVSVFGNNLTNQHTPLAIAHDLPGSLPYYVSS